MNRIPAARPASGGSENGMAAGAGRHRALAAHAGAHHALSTRAGAHHTVPHHWCLSLMGTRILSWQRDAGAETPQERNDESGNCDPFRPWILEKDQELSDLAAFGFLKAASSFFQMFFPAQDQIQLLLDGLDALAISIAQNDQFHRDQKNPAASSSRSCVNPFTKRAVTNKIRVIVITASEPRPRVFQRFSIPSSRCTE